MTYGPSPRKARLKVEGLHEMQQAHEAKMSKLVSGVLDCLTLSAARRQ